MAEPIVQICDNAEALASSAADLVIRAARESVEARGRFNLVLAGGSTPETTYDLLAQPERAEAVEWPKTYLFFGDERFVPAEDPASNFGLARRSLLARAAVPSSHVFRMPTDEKTPAEGAAAYTRVLATFFAQAPDSLPAPRFDLVLLGLGDDGHTASLFPGRPAVDVEDHWVTWTRPGVLPPPVDRITLTFPMLNAARQVVFLVAGEKKARILSEVLQDHPGRRRYPAAGVRPTEGTLLWLVDKAAASCLL